MERTSTVSIKVLRGLVAVLAAGNLVRAMTLPVTLGEALNYNRFIQPPWREALEHFDLNNHVLNTILVRISTARIHLTELSLRLPSLLAGLLYLWVVYRVVMRRFGAGPLAVVVFGLLTLNPMVVDAMSEARGYGMGLAALLWALELMLESAESFSRAKFNLAAVCLGLSVAASLAFSAPALALMLVFLAWGSGWLWPKGQGTAFALLAFLTAFVFLAVPVDHVSAGAFLAGATSLRQTINEISALSFGTSIKAIGAVARVGVAMLAIVSAAVAIRLWRRSGSGLVVLSGGCLALSLLILLAAHRWFHSPFPQGGAVYLIPLCTLSFSALLFNWNHKAAKIALYAAGILLIPIYLTQTDFLSYASAEEYAGGRALAKKLRAEVGRGGVRVGVSRSAEPVMRYYQTRLRQGNWEVIGRAPLTGSFDYYVLAGPDRAWVQERHLQVLYEDTGLILAR